MGAQTRIKKLLDTALIIIFSMYNVIVIKIESHKQFTLHKNEVFIKDFFSKCDQIGSFLRIWSYLLKEFLTENYIFSENTIVLFTLFQIFFQYSWKFKLVSKIIPRCFWDETYLTGLIKGRMTHLLEFPEESNLLGLFTRVKFKTQFQL